MAKTHYFMQIPEDLHMPDFLIGPYFYTLLFIVLFIIRNR